MTSGISAHTIVHKRWMLLSDRLMIDNRYMDNTDYMNDNSKKVDMYDSERKDDDYIESTYREQIFTK